jgi:hypothetical protein
MGQRPCFCPRQVRGTRHQEVDPRRNVGFPAPRPQAGPRAFRSVSAPRSLGRSRADRSARAPCAPRSLGRCSAVRTYAHQPAPSDQ